VVVCGGIEAGDDEVEQLRGAGQIPVGVARVDVAEIGGQRRHVGLHVQAVSIPVEQVRTAKLWRRS